MPDETPENGEPEDELEENEPPDESTLLGATGVEEEVLAELARAEAELSEGRDETDEEARGAQV